MDSICVAVRHLIALANTGPPTEVIKIEDDIGR